MNQFYKILLWAFVFALSSCRTEEVLYSSPIQGESYTAKSLWKEDEVFIKNVKKIYDENANPIRMYSEYGEVYWDYASSLNTFDERYLIAPIVKGNQVVAYMEARRKGGSVYFEFTKGDNKVNTFFNPLIFKDKHLKSVSPSDRSSSLEEGVEVNGYPQRVLECKVITVTLIIGQVEGGPYDGEDITKTETRTVCKFVDGPELPVDHCIGDYDQYGNCQVSGGGYGGGYSYPNEEEEEHKDNCSKVKSIISDKKFQEKFNELNTPANFNLNHEVGYFEKNGEFFPANSAPCTYELKANASVDGITGIIHTHPSVNCEGRYNERVPSWGDILVFLRIPVEQAKKTTGSSKNAYHVTVTPFGSYMIKYNKDNPPTNTNYNLEAGGEWYDMSLQNLEDDCNYNQEDIEHLFMEYMNKYAQIEGLEIYKLDGNKVSLLQYDTATKKSNLLLCP